MVKIKYCLYRYRPFLNQPVIPQNGETIRELIRDVFYTEYIAVTENEKYILLAINIKGEFDQLTGVYDSVIQLTTANEMKAQLYETEFNEDLDRQSVKNVYEYLELAQNKLGR